MNKAEFSEAIVGAMRELHSEGQEWVFMLDVARTMHAREIQNERYLRTYRRNSKILSVVIGIRRPETPERFIGSGRLFPTFGRLERTGVVESQWQDSEPGTHSPRRMGYRLVDPEPPAPVN